MSAFIVSEETMHVVVAAFLNEQADGSCEEGDRIGRRLFALNARAVAFRYPKDKSMFESGEALALDYRFRPRVPSVLVQIKALSCWLHQCTEGEEVPSDPLYARAEALRSRLALDLIGSMPAYQNAAGWA